jgi:hypothetical protein
MVTCAPVVPAPWHMSIGIGILGFLGVAVPLLREKIGRREKAFWTALLALLLWLEICAIRIEEIQHDREQEFARCEDRRQFSEIARRIDSSIQQSRDQFQTTVSSLERVFSKTEQVVDRISGTGSYPCVVPQIHGVPLNGIIVLEIENKGSAGNPLTGVEVVVLNLKEFLDQNEHPKPPTVIGTLMPAYPKIISGPLISNREVPTNGVYIYTNLHLDSKWIL